MLAPQFNLPIHAELKVDLFAGGGGASTGIEQATGFPPDLAVNHDPEAVALHQANHPQTRHFCSDVFEVDPLTVTEGRPVGLLWASPDCKHFSKAKGGKPVSKKIRSLAWVVIKWAKLVQPRVICLENVEEFQTWGPLGADNMPCPKRKGQTFNRWVSRLRNLGYAVEWRELRACDFGAPTIRKRLFLVARRDGMPIVWPEPTHAAPGSLALKAKKLKPWRTAAECIDWSIPAPSIFERARPLVDATCKRVAKGIVRYVTDSADPFIVNTRNGERAGQQPRVRSIHEPAWTTTALGSQNALCVPTLAPFITEHANASTQRTFNADEPLRTQVAQIKGGHFSQVSAFLTKFNTGSTGFAADTPMHTIIAGGEQARPGTAITQGIVTANLVHYHADKRAEDVRASDMRDPIKTQTTENRHALVTSHLVKLRNNQFGQSVEEPIPTLTAGGGHVGEVRAFLVKYYGTDQDPQLQEPLHTVTTKDRFGVVTVRMAPLYLGPELLGRAHQVALFMRDHGYDFGDLVIVSFGGQDYVLVDIGLRMLIPRELYRAQGFPESYIIDRGADGRPLTKTAQVRMCGNSVCPPLARALVAANYTDAQAMREAA